MEQIAEYLSQKVTTASPRFSIQMPETVYDDLLQCYSLFVRASEREMQLTADTKKVLQSAVNWLKAGKRGLLLYGNCGTGKSKLMQALFHLLAYYYNRAEIAKRIYKASVIAKGEHEGSVEKIYRCLSDEKFDTWRYLGIDDLGTEPVIVKKWGTETSPIIDILCERYDAMKVTVLSTNLNMENIREAYGERIFDRICEMYDRISFNFQSFRQKQ